MNSIWAARAIGLAVTFGIGSAVTSGFQNPTTEDPIRILAEVNRTMEDHIRIPSEENHERNMIILGLFLLLCFSSCFYRDYPHFLSTWRTDEVFRLDTPAYSRSDFPPTYNAINSIL